MFKVHTYQHPTNTDSSPDHQELTQWITVFGGHFRQMFDDFLQILAMFFCLISCFCSLFAWRSARSASSSGAHSLEGSLYMTEERFRAVMVMDSVARCPVKLYSIHSDLHSDSWHLDCNSLNVSFPSISFPTKSPSWFFPVSSTGLAMFQSSESPPEIRTVGRNSKWARTPFWDSKRTPSRSAMVSPKMRKFGVA